MSDLDYEMDLEYTIDYIEKENGRLEAENKRLRDVLDGIAECCYCQFCSAAAKSALEGEKEK